MTRNGKKIIVYFVPLPKEIGENIHGMVTEDSTGYYIMIDSSRTEDEQKRILGHELAHIFLGHLEDRRVSDPEAEAEADRAAAYYYKLYAEGAA